MRRSITASLALATVVALALGASAAAGDTFIATTITLTSKTAKAPLDGRKPSPGVICATCDGSGNAACGSAWVDKHYDTWTGSYGIHGSVTWCWNGSSVWNVSIPLSPWANNRYSVTGYSQ